MKRIVVAGAGTMGSSIALIFARKGYEVTLYDVSEKALVLAKEKITENIKTLIQEKQLDGQQAQLLFSYLNYTSSKNCFSNCDLVVENIIENLKIKQDFHHEISHMVNDTTIIATNTSGLSINAIASKVHKPQRFIGMHWFNPAHLILLVEIIKADQTTDETAQEIYDLSISIDKKPVIIHKDIAGFAANRIQFAVLREALDLVENGVVSKEGIDDVMKYGLGFRYACLGPLEVADFGGLDTFYHIASYLMKDLCDSKEIPILLKECYEKGYYGVKSKKGFYDYSDHREIEVTKKRDENLLKIFNALYGNKSQE